eukprot:13779976-Alexandrium_andersonii.AAC.1
MPDAAVCFGRADCGLRRIAALPGLEHSVDCTCGTLPCEAATLDVCVCGVDADAVVGVAWRS